jgi:steroid 5-alpha reductase family enzyme
MTFFNIYIQGFLVIMIMMSLLWVISVIIKNASIVDPFWGLGFVVAAGFYFLKTGSPEPRKIILLTLVTIWGLRLSSYLFWRNIGKGEDFRYGQFRKNYGEKRYWWISYFQVFLLQGILMWLVSAPLLGAQFYDQNEGIGVLDIIGIFLWVTGIIFEAGGDFQLAAFKTNPLNKGKVLDKGLWKYTRHPNYFGDSAVWWGYGIICLGAGSYFPVLGSLLMTLLIIKVSGVTLLEKNLKEQKPQYRDYIERTSAFLPWFPKRKTTNFPVDQP